MRTVEETVTISKEKYESLVRDARFLSALEAVGVDNWDGYSSAYGILEEWYPEYAED